LDIEQYNLNTTVTEPITILLTLQAIISAGYAVYTTFKNIQDIKDGKKKLAHANVMVNLFKTTQTNLCQSVREFLASLVRAGQMFVQSSQNPDCSTHEYKIALLKRYLAGAHGQPFGKKADIDAIVHKVCSAGFTTQAAIELNLEILWWRGVEQGLGCSALPVDTTFLEAVWSGSPATTQASSSLLQKHQLNPINVIGVGLFITVIHTDMFSATGAFSPVGSAADVYEHFTTDQVEGLRLISCRLSYPMYLRSLRVEALERALLALDFESAGLDFPSLNDLDVCGKTSQCQYRMVCLKQERCLRAIVDMFPPGSDCHRDEVSLAKERQCFSYLMGDKDTSNKLSNFPVGSECKLLNDEFYKFCGARRETTITTIVPVQCFSWQQWEPQRANSYERMKPVAEYQASEGCSRPFQSLLDAYNLIGKFSEEKEACNW